MRSPEQQFAFAKTLPISELAKVLQGQSDAVDMSIADMMLRIKTRADSIQKGIAAQQMKQQPKVVEKDLMNAGIAAAPVDVNVPQGGIVGSDGQMSNTGAGGGIVAFAAGSQEPIGTPLTRQGSSYLERRRLEDTVRNMYGPKAGPAGMFMSQTDAQRQQAQDIINRVSSMSLAELQALATQNNLPIATTSAQAPVSKGISAAEKALADQAAQIEAGQGPNAQKGIAALAGSQQSGPVPGLSEETLALLRKAAEDKKRTEEAASSSVRGPRSFDDAYAEASRIAAKISPLTKPEVPSTAMAVQTEKDILSAAGYDFNMYKDQIKELKEDAEKDKSRKSEAMNLRLLEAGLGILGGESPHAFVNIGKGASPAAKGLAEDIKEIQKLDRDRRKEMRTLATAQNQVAAGIGGKASERLQKAQERVDRLDEREQALKADLAKTLHSADTQKYIADKSAATQKEIAAMPGKDERLYRSLATDPELVKGIEAYARATGQSKDTLLTALIKDPLALSALKTNNPQLYAMIMSKITTSLVPSVVTGTPNADKIRP